MKMFQKLHSSESEKVYQLNAIVACFEGLFFSDILTAQPTGAFIQKKERVYQHVIKGWHDAPRTTP